MYITRTTSGRKRYIARVKRNDKSIYLGSFDTPGEANDREDEYRISGDTSIRRKPQAKVYSPITAKRSLEMILSSNKYVIPKRG